MTDALSVVLGVAGAVGGVGGVASLLLTRARGRNLDAQSERTRDEGTAAVMASGAKVIEAASLSLPTLQAEVARQGAQLEAATQRADRLERELDRERDRRERLEATLDEDRRALDDVAEVHAAWDRSVVAALERAGEHVDPPPPLRPKRRPLVMPNDVVDLTSS